MGKVLIAKGKYFLNQASQTKIPPGLSHRGLSRDGEITTCLIAVKVKLIPSAANPRMR